MAIRIQIGFLKRLRFESIVSQYFYANFSDLTMIKVLRIRKNCIVKT